MKSYIWSKLKLSFAALGLALVVALMYSPKLVAVGETLTETDSRTISLSLEPTAMTVDGCVAPYSIISIFNNNLAIGTAVADGSGEFSKYIILEKHGLHNVKVYSEDSSGFVTATITRNFNAKDHFNTFIHTTLSPTVSIGKSVFTSGEKISFIGSGCPDAPITLKIDNVYTLNTTANAQGKWFAVVSTVGFAYGEHSYYVGTPDTADSLATSARQLFRVVTSGETEAGQDKLDLDELQPPTISIPTDNYLSSSPDVTITGTAQPNVQVEVLRDGYVIGSVFSNPLGEWTFSFIMLDAQHSLRTRTCISFGCSVLSNEITVYFQGVLDECNFTWEFAKYRFFRQSAGRGIDLHMTKIDSVPPYELIIDWGDDAVENTQIATNRSIKYHHIYKFIGNYTGAVAISDSLGCLQTQYFSVEVVEGKTAVSWFIWLLVAGYGFALAGSKRGLLTLKTLKKS